MPVSRSVWCRVYALQFVLKSVDATPPRGLTNKGHILIDEMMNRKFIIDVDHLSRKTLNTVLSKAEDRRYPLISGHSFLFDKPLTEFGREGFRTEAHITEKAIGRIRDLGGIVSALSPRKEGSSTKDYVKMYNYLLPIMKDNMPLGPDNPGIAFSADWGAMFFQVAPRCPLSGSCTTLGDCVDLNGQITCTEIDSSLTYPFMIEGVDGKFNEQQTGTRKFDFNTDGLAHVGLLPDFMAEPQASGPEY